MATQVLAPCFPRVPVEPRRTARRPSGLTKSLRLPAPRTPPAPPPPLLRLPPELLLHILAFLSPTTPHLRADLASLRATLASASLTARILRRPAQALLLRDVVVSTPSSLDRAVAYARKALVDERGTFAKALTTGLERGGVRAGKVAELLLYLPHLEALDVCQADVDSRSDETWLALALLTSLRTLRLRSFSSAAVLSRLLSAVSTPTLAVVVFAPDCTPDLHRVPRVAAPSLVFQSERVPYAIAKQSTLRFLYVPHPHCAGVATWMYGLLVEAAARLEGLYVGSRRTRPDPRLTALFERALEGARFPRLRVFGTSWAYASLDAEGFVSRFGDVLDAVETMFVTDAAAVGWERVRPLWARLAASERLKRVVVCHQWPGGGGEGVEGMLPGHVEVRVWKMWGVDMRALVDEGTLGVLPYSERW